MYISIQANEIMARVGSELSDGIECIFPARIGSGGPRTSAKQPSADVLDAFDQTARPVCSGGNGYLQFMDGDGLIELPETDVMYNFGDYGCAPDQVSS